MCRDATLLMPQVIHPGNVPQRLPRSAMDKWSESLDWSMTCASPIARGGTDSVEGAMSSEDGRVGQSAMCERSVNVRTGACPQWRGKIARLRHTQLPAGALVAAITMSRGCTSSALQLHPFLFPTISNMAC